MGFRYCSDKILPSRMCDDLNKIKSGDNVSWTYEHHLNRQSSTMITKTGRFYGLVKHTCKYTGSQLAVVHFEGNKYSSRVKFYQLKKNRSNRTCR